MFTALAFMTKHTATTNCFGEIHLDLPMLLYNGREYNETQGSRQCEPCFRCIIIK